MTGLEIDFDVTEHGTATVGALTEALRQCDPSLPVRTEGCDCIGYVWSLTQFAGEVSLNRSGGASTPPAPRTAEEVVAAMLKSDPGALNDTRADLLED